MCFRIPFHERLADLAHGFGSLADTCGFDRPERFAEGELAHRRTLVLLQKLKKCEEQYWPDDMPLEEASSGMQARALQLEAAERELRELADDPQDLRTCEKRLRRLARSFREWAASKRREPELHRRLLRGEPEIRGQESDSGQPAGTPRQDSDAPTEAPDANPADHPAGRVLLQEMPAAGQPTLQTEDLLACARAGRATLPQRLDPWLRKLRAAGLAERLTKGQWRRTPEGDSFLADECSPPG